MITLPADAAIDQVGISYRGSSYSHIYWQQLEIENLSGSADLTNLAVRVRAIAPSIFIGDRVVTEGQVIQWTPDFALVSSRMYAAWVKGETPSEQDKQDYYTRRDFVIPVLNRGCLMRFVFIATAPEGSTPEPWLTCVHPGVVTKRDQPGATVLGVKQVRASATGILVGLAAAVGLSFLMTSRMGLALTAFMIGAFCLHIGAVVVLAWKKLRQVIG